MNPRNDVAHPVLSLVSPTGAENSHQMFVSATINRKPLPLQRGIATVKPSGKIRVVNAQAKYIKQFRDDVRKQMGSLPVPLFSNNEPVSLTVIVNIRRPNCHFVNGKRSNQLKNNMVNCRVTGGDIDNYLKFVLDALNHTVYHDDKQVCRLYVEKRWAMESESEGSTSFTVCQYDMTTNVQKDLM